MLLCSMIAVACCGCAYLSSTTYDATTGQRTTKVRSFEFFDANAQLTKFHNRSELTRSNEWAPGTTIGTLNQESSGTNTVDLVRGIAEGIVKGLK